MDTCAFHPDHAAIESCEICAQPLCGLCLWYTGSGRRLCRQHAQERAEAGEQVLSPQTYHEAIAPSLARNAGAGDEDSGLYRGNTSDLSGLLAAVVGVTTLFSCVGGIYCLPLAVLLLGASAYLNASQAVDPVRTRRLALVGLGVVAIMGLLVLALILFYIALFAFVIISGGP